MQWQRERDKFDRKELFFCFSNTSSFSRPTGGRLSIQDILSLLIALNVINWKAVKFSSIFLYDSNFIEVALCEENGQLTNYSQEPKLILINLI